MTKIMVVDDDPRIGHLLRTYLESINHEVVTASDGFEAMEKVEQEHPLIVFLDIEMPVKNGLEVLKEIKKYDPNIVVIMITGLMSEAVGRQALALGAFDYIVKPFDMDYLERVLSWKLKMI